LGAVNGSAGLGLSVSAIRIDPRRHTKKHEETLSIGFKEVVCHPFGKL
jgi:hypothetical protein